MSNESNASLFQITPEEIFDMMTAKSPFTETLVAQLQAEVDAKSEKRTAAAIQETIDEVSNTEKWGKIEFIYYGDPKAQPRAKINRVMNRLYDPAATIKQFVVEQTVHLLPPGFKLLDKEIFLKASYYRPMPKSATPAKKILMEMGIARPLVKPDVDNYDKLLMDALTGVLYGDDSVIVSSYTDKFYSSKPRVEFSIVFRI